MGNPPTAELKEVKRGDKVVTCPSCHSEMTYSNFLRSRACLNCQASLGFSLSHRMLLGAFGIGIYLYLSYRAVMLPSFTTSVLGLVLAAPLALLARLFFLSTVRLPIVSLGLLKCPLCEGSLTRFCIRPGPFNCPNCLKQIKATRTPAYKWARIGICAALAIAVSRLRGFDWSFLVFVVSIYALPALFFWDIFALDLAPALVFEPTRSSVQRLRIEQDRDEL